MSNYKKFKAGDTLGRAIVVEGDDMDVFGNPTSKSNPMVLEGNLNYQSYKLETQAKNAKARGIFGRVVICKLVFVEEITLDDQL